MSDRPENPAHAALIARLLARADRAADILEPALSWAENHPASRAAAIRKQKPVHRAFVVTFQALRCHADALRAIQHAVVLVGCDGFDDAADAAEIGLDMCMARAGRAVEAVEVAESRGRCGKRSAPKQNTLRADRDRLIDDYLNGPGRRSPESAGVHMAAILATRWRDVRGAGPETIAKLIRARQKKSRKE